MYIAWNDGLKWAVIILDAKSSLSPVNNLSTGVIIPSEQAQQRAKVLVVLFLDSVYSDSKLGDLGISTNFY